MPRVPNSIFPHAMYITLEYNYGWIRANWNMNSVEDGACVTVVHCGVYTVQMLVQPIRHIYTHEIFNDHNHHHRRWGHRWRRQHRRTHRGPRLHDNRQNRMIWRLNKITMITTPSCKLFISVYGRCLERENNETDDPWPTINICFSRS